jgi:hypothetical protein
VAVAALIATSGCGRSIRQVEPTPTDSAAGAPGADGGDGDSGAPAEEPEELVSLPHVAACVSALAVDERDVFWIGLDEAGAIAVGSAPKLGGPARQLVRLPPPKVSDAYAIAVDEESVYFAGARVDGLGQVLAVNKSGGETRVVAPFRAVGLLMDASSLVLGTYGGEMPGIYVVPARNSEPRHVPGTESGVYRELASDETHLYWTSATTLLRVPKAGGRAEIVRENVESYPGVTAVDSGEVYWADADGWLKRAPVDGGTPTPLAELDVQAVEARDQKAYGIGARAGVNGFFRVKSVSSVEFVRGAFTAFALDSDFAYLARCEYVCLIDGAPPDCPRSEYNAAVVRLRLD